MAHARKEFSFSLTGRRQPVAVVGQRAHPAQRPALLVAASSLPQPGNAASAALASRWPPLTRS